MKLLNTNVRINARDSFGQGLDATFTLLLFVAAGFGLDVWLGTLPWFMIGLTLVAGIGIFYKLKIGYEAKMDQLERQRRRGPTTPTDPASGGRPR